MAWRQETLLLSTIITATLTFAKYFSARGRKVGRDAFLLHLLAFEVDQNIRDFYLPCFPLLANPSTAL